MSAILVSALLFSAVHLGKDVRELALSSPGGICLAYFAYRCNSWLAPFIIHLLIAGTACLMMILLESM